MKSKAILLGVLLIFLSVSAEGLRCGTQIVSIGDPEAKVLNACGKPTTITPGEKKIVKSITYATGIKREVRNTIEVSKWTYNFGSTDFIYYLTFEDGQLVKIRTNGYGY